MSGYVPPVGTTLSPQFSETTPYTPPAGNAINFDFSASGAGSGGTNGGNSYYASNFFVLLL